MARSRNIKPGLYKNEDLAECSVWARYLFPGLWCIADRAGRLEDRPKRIKGDLLPYDSVEVEPLLVELARWGFISRYEVDGRRMIQINAFSKHQNPHRKEKASELPAMPGYVEPEAEPDSMDEKPGAFVPSDGVDARGKPGALESSEVGAASGKTDTSLRQAQGSVAMGGGASPADSLFSDSLISDSNTSGGKPPLPPGFARFWTAWPKHFRKEARGECLKAWGKAGCESIVESILAHVERKKLADEWTKQGGEFIPAPLVYLNKRRWEGAEDDAAPAAANPWAGALQ